MIHKSKIPIFVPVYNQFTYVRQMVQQIEPYFDNITIIDNASTFQPLLSYYRNEFEHTLLRLEENNGPRIYDLECIRRLDGNLYFLTDPDLKFNPRLPETWIQDFIDISEEHRANKVGFALDISSGDIRPDITVCSKRVQEWETPFWANEIPHGSLEMYFAPIDTTMALLNNQYPGGPSIRVAGPYTCRHIPWHEDFRKGLLEGEYEAIREGNRWSHWW